MRLFLCLSFIFLGVNLLAQPTEEERKGYVEAICKAFELQSLGKTRQAFYAFKNVYQAALKNGESPAKLALLEELFIWYRIYGYDSGVMAEPSGCREEHRSYRSFDDFEEIRELDPHQQKMIREFLYGVGSLVSGIFCVTVAPPVTGRFGATLIVGWIKCMFSAINSMMEDHELKMKRIAELDKIVKKATLVIGDE